MKRNLLTLLAAACMLVSCGTSKFFVGSTAASVQPVALVQPYSYITNAVIDIQTQYVEEASLINQQLLTEETQTLGLAVQTVVPFECSPVDMHDPVSIWLFSLSNVAAKEAAHLIVPDDLKNAVAESGCRYGLVLVDVGYVKSAKQYVVEEAVGVGLSILEAVIDKDKAMIHGSSNSAHANAMFSLIFDATTGQVLWYGARRQEDNFNPTDRSHMRRQLGYLFKDFLK